MNKIIRYCEEHKILLTKEQQQTDIKFNIRKIYSSYLTSLGVIFYINTNKGDFFLHLYKTGGFRTEDGFDGGNLYLYNKVKGYV